MFFSLMWNKEYIIENSDSWEVNLTWWSNKIAADYFPETAWQFYKKVFISYPPPSLSPYALLIKFRQGNTSLKSEKNQINQNIVSSIHIKVCFHLSVLSNKFIHSFILTRQHLTTIKIIHHQRNILQILMLRNRFRHPKF